MPEYTVQFIVVKEVVVDSPNDIQAEKDAYRQLNHRDHGGVIASVVLDVPNNGGCLEGGFGYGWAFAKENCDSVDVEWLEQED